MGDCRSVEIDHEHVKLIHVKIGDITRVGTLEPGNMHTAPQLFTRCGNNSGSMLLMVVTPLLSTDRRPVITRYFLLLVRSG